MIRLSHIAIAALLVLGAARTQATPDPDPVVNYRLRVIASYPHPGAPFTQGLIAGTDGITETSGGYAVSYIQRYLPGNDGDRSSRTLPRRWFAEGLARTGDRLWVLTWHGGTALVLDTTTLDTVRRVFYHGQGWGLASTGSELVMSDGSATLTFRRPTDFSVIRHLPVTLDGHPVERLNELEWVRGWILANVWLTDSIVIIDPHSGVVHGRIDAAKLHTAGTTRDPDAVANGIAFDGKHLFVTGKRWPVLYQVELEPPLPAAGTGAGGPIE